MIAMRSGAASQARASLANAQTAPQQTAECPAPPHAFPQMTYDIRLWQAGKNSLTLRAGRHEMAFGNNSLISTRDGRNVRRSFDGLRMTGRWDEWSADVLAAKPSESKPGTFDDGIDPSSNFWGVYAVGPLAGLPGGHIDLYYLGLGDRSVKYDQGTEREQRESVGTRLWGRTDRWNLKCYRWEDSWPNSQDRSSFRVSSFIRTLH